jgi:acyl dehydratase
MRSFAKGDVLFEKKLASPGRGRVALFSTATEDPNPIHVDEAFAAKAGFPNVLQQGPMTTAQFALLLSEIAGAPALKSLDVTFTAPVYPEDELILRAEVTDVGSTVRCVLSASKPDGTQTAKGTAELGVAG